MFFPIFPPINSQISDVYVEEKQFVNENQNLIKLKSPQINSEIIQYLNFHYEVWAKGGKGPDFSVNNQADYILHLNWLSNWIDVYFIGKFSDYILVIIAIILIFTLCKS